MHNYSATQKVNSVKALTASVVGARGYSGLALCSLLVNHPFVELKAAFATTDFKLSDESMDSRFDQVKCLPESAIRDFFTDIVFLATPAEASLKLAPELLKRGSKVIDLSGAFRLKDNDYKKWYNFTHPETELLADAHYGLQAYAGASQTANLVSNPGCYATAISLALIPLLKNKLVDTKNIVIDAKSGTSGAGRKAQENLLFSEVVGECLPYKVGKHQHLPEIQESVKNFSGVSIDPHFSTSLLATSRGIIAGIYMNALTDDISLIEKAYQDDFKNYPLVKFSSKISQYASLKKVVGTPYTHISYELVGKKLYVFSCIDNLMKGAASQAVENFNTMIGLAPEFSLVPDSLEHLSSNVPPQNEVVV